MAAGDGRAGGVACYIRHDLMYKRLNDMEVHDLEVMWMKVMPYIGGNIGGSRCLKLVVHKS